MTSHSVNQNKEIEFNGNIRFRMVNFMRAPFFLPAPICLSKDTTEDHMFIFLYKLEDLLV